MKPFYILLLLIGIGLGILFSNQIYWYYVYNGNVIVYIIYQNNKRVESQMTLHVNGKKIYDGVLTDTIPMPYQEKQVLTRLGPCKMVFWRADLNETTEVYWTDFRVKWIVIDAFSRRTKIESHSIPPLLQ
jgi:hypothetical protein